MTNGPKTPEEALAHIREASRTGLVSLAPDVLTRQYDAEIQEIFAAIRIQLRGEPPRRPIWVADGQRIGFVLEWDADGGYAPESIAACEIVGKRLGVEITPLSIWEDVAARLRESRRKISVGRSALTREVQTMLGGLGIPGGYKVAKSIVALAEAPEGTFSRIEPGKAGAKRPMSQAEAARIVGSAARRIALVDEED